MFDWHYSRAAPEATPSAEPGARFGPYEILEELGRGGMGVVLRAREPDTQRELALKVVLEEGLTEDRLQRFVREGEVTARLVHPGIARVHAAGEVEGRPYLAYELVEDCVELGEAWEGLGQRERVRHVIDAAQALGYAHAQGVIHRDVKPANVLVDGAGRVKIADFGLATASGVEQLTQTGAVLGTPTHMSPEQFAGAEREQPVGPPTDVWSLGVMLYTALTDELPFQAGSLYELCARVMTEPHRAPRSVDSSVTPGLQAVCDKALEKNPRDRYTDAAELADDLDRALRGHAVRATEGASQRRLLAALAALGAVVALLLVALLLTRGPSAAALRARADSLDAQTARLLRVREPLASDAATRAELARELEALRADGGSTEDLALSTARLEGLRGLEACSAGDVAAAREALAACGEVRTAPSAALKGTLRAFDAATAEEAQAAEALLERALKQLRRPEILAWRGLTRRKRGPASPETGAAILADLRPLAESGQPLAAPLREAQLWAQVWRGQAPDLDASELAEAPRELRHAASMLHLADLIICETPRPHRALEIVAALVPLDPALLGSRRKGVAARCRQLAQEVEGLDQAGDQNKVRELTTPANRIAEALRLAQLLEPETPISEASIEGLIYVSQVCRSPELAGLISDLVPDDWDRHFSLVMVASLFKQASQGEIALKVIRRGVALAPTLDAQVGVKSHLCNALVRLERYDELRPALEDVLAIAPQTDLRANILLLRAHVRERDGDFDGARADQREAQRIRDAD